MKCAICEKENGVKKIELYASNKESISLCEEHAAEFEKIFQPCRSLLKGGFMKCTICEKEEGVRNIELYASNKESIPLCEEHAAELKIMCERRFINKYQPANLQLKMPVRIITDSNTAKMGK